MFGEPAPGVRRRHAPRFPNVSERFSIKFDGPAVRDLTIDAAEFGTAMLALADLIHEAEEALDPSALSIGCG